MGDGTEIDKYLPVQVPGLTEAKAIAAGVDHVLVVKDDRTVWAWGKNDAGQLGIGSTIPRFTPFQVAGLVNVKGITGGDYHSVALVEDGTVWAWGHNGNGQIGVGNDLFETRPVCVREIANNFAPVLEPVGNKTIMEQSELDFQIYAGDLNGDDLTFSASDLASGVYFDQWGHFNWQPGNGQAGSYNVTFTVSDGRLSDSEEIVITVEGNVNYPPVFDTIGNKTVVEEQMLQFSVNASDADNDELFYSTGNLPEGASFDPSTKTFSWTPGLSQAGEYTVQFIVSDGKVSETENVTIFVLNNDNTFSTPAGENIEVTQPSTNTTILFEQVNSGGATTITNQDTEPSGNYFNVSTLPVYYDISTTATFSGNVTVKINYTLPTGFNGNEADLRLYQYRDGQLVDITSPVNPVPGGNPDTALHCIQGITDHFCYFVVGFPNKAPVAEAGPDQNVICESGDSAVVTLDGTGSLDPDASLGGLNPPNVIPDGRSIVSYTWTGPFGSVTGINPTVNIPVGSHTIILEVSDGLIQSSDIVHITVTKPSITNNLFLHGNGSAANPATLFLDTSEPISTTVKYKDSASIKFSGGNLWKEIGTWNANLQILQGILTDVSDFHTWLGLKNSDDQDANFDLRVEVKKNNQVVAAGEIYAIPGVTRNPDNAKEVIVSFSPCASETFNGSTDVLSISIYTRIGTDGAGNFAGGHSSAVGLRLYFDSVSRSSRFVTTLEQ